MIDLLTSSGPPLGYHTARAVATDRGRPAAAWVALGANLGDPRRAIARALRWIDAVPGVRVEARSRVHWTEPVGPPQPRFANAVARVGTTLPPEPLLAALHRLERAAGRVRAARWGPRTLDLDLVAWGSRALCSTTLTLPHPRMHERAFVLAPLCDIDPGWRHPRLGVRADALLATLKERRNEGKIEVGVRTCDYRI